MRKLFLVILALGLGFVVSAKFVFAFLVPEVEPTLKQPLEEAIPAQMPGWRSQKVPLSSTPEGVDRVLSVLDLDDVFSREYTKGDTRVMIYAAYWYPGSEPYSSVAIHNPDSCWVIAGWEIEDRESNRRTSLAGIDLKEHEWGRYSRDGQVAHVLFWHLLGGKPNKYIKHMLWTSTGLDSIKRQFYFVFNMYQMGLDLGEDQLFLRVSSNKSFAELEESGDLRQILDHLSALEITRASE
mgnify:CR=1 FL=1